MISNPIENILTLESRISPAFDSAITTLEHFGDDAIRLARTMGIRILLMPHGTRYAAVSPHVKRYEFLDENYNSIDDWPEVPWGLFIIRERTGYIRQISSVAIAHEFAHGLDFALHGNDYYSNHSTDIQRAFLVNATRNTQHCIDNVNEYFAESIVAYLGINGAKDPSYMLAWRKRFFETESTMACVIEDLFTSGFSQALQRNTLTCV